MCITIEILNTQSIPILCVLQHKYSIYTTNSKKFIEINTCITSTPKPFLEIPHDPDPHRYQQG